jgi:hypothetical protein
MDGREPLGGTGLRSQNFGIGVWEKRLRRFALNALGVFAFELKLNQHQKSGSATKNCPRWNPNS